MKKLFVSVLALSGFLFPLLAQVDHDREVSEVVPVESLTLKKEQIPQAIVKAVGVDFSTGKPVTWGKFPFNLQNYGWVVNKDMAGEKPDHYEVLIKAKDGSDIYAVYTADGTILQSKSVYKNIPVPAEVSTKLANSQYKDWTVVGDKELIRYFKNKMNVEEHFRLTIQKGKEKRTVSFNYKEPRKE
jgi:hypothetical protein